MKKKNTIKKWAGRIHLWLGLASGLIVFIVAITGCIFVFQDEIQDVAYSWRKVSVKDQSFIEPSILFEKTKGIFPKATSTFIRYNTKDRPAQVYAVNDKIPYYLYFDPYSGKLTHVQNLKKDFFIIVEYLHMQLLLPEAIGTQITGISTLVFVVMLMTGIILWWPKKRKHLASSLKVKWGAKWRRINYDLHRTAGVYAAIIALILAITGLGFSYEWVNDGLYVVGNLGRNYPEDQNLPEIGEKLDQVSKSALDLAFEKTRERMPKSAMYFVFDQGKAKPILTGAYPDEMAYDHQSNFYFHPKTGKLLKTVYYNDKSPGLKLQEMKYGLHTGQYFGLPGKIIAFIASLFVAGLPVTGFLVWWGRRNKKKN